MTKKSWDARERECIYDHGWKINDDGLLELTRKQFLDYSWSGKSIYNPNIRTMMLPSTFGCCLIFEHKHFIIV